MNPLDADAAKFKHWTNLMKDHGKIIGSGTYGEVYKIKPEESKIAYALKMYNYVEPHDGEVDILREFYNDCNKHLLCFKDVVYSEKNTPLYLVTDFLEGYVTLEKYFNGMSRWPIEQKYEDSYDVLRSCVEVLKWFHTKGFAHLDIKADNIMIHPGSKNIKLVDFGRSCSNHVVCHIDDFDDVEDYPYLAPEFRRIGAKQDGGSVSLEEAKSMDIYSMSYMIVGLIMELFKFDESFSLMLLGYIYGITIKFTLPRDLSISKSSSKLNPDTFLKYYETFKLKVERQRSNATHSGRRTPKVFPIATPKALIKERQATPKAPTQKTKMGTQKKSVTKPVMHSFTEKPRPTSKPKRKTPHPHPPQVKSPTRTPDPKFIPTPPSPSIYA